MSDGGQPAPANGGRARDAAHTSHLLLEAARTRFSRDGYAATTVRDIAADVGVNVALISRYFGSKEGLFERCLTLAAEDLGRPDIDQVTVDQVLGSVLRRALDSQSGDGQSLQMLLLLRSSGDERTDAIRRNILQSFVQRIAVAAGWDPSSPESADHLLRAQVALAMALGVVQLRSTGLEPLASATEDSLGAPLHDVLAALLAGDH